jgi:hypothetical protein
MAGGSGAGAAFPIFEGTRVGTTAATAAGSRRARRCLFQASLCQPVSLPAGDGRRRGEGRKEGREAREELFNHAGPRPVRSEHAHDAPDYSIYSRSLENSPLSHSNGRAPSWRQGTTTSDDGAGSYNRNRQPNLCSCKACLLFPRFRFRLPGRAAVLSCCRSCRGAGARAFQTPNARALEKSATTDEPPGPCYNLERYHNRRLPS